MIRISRLLLGGMMLLPSPALAQYIGGNAPPPPAAPLAGTVETPEAALARNVRLLAIDPKDYTALLGAGRAALKLGDAEAAIGFFGRAEEVHADQWAPKAGQGSSLAQMGEGQAALGMFEQAQRLGATQSMIALDRGLALDLLGRQAEAQSDYRSVLAGPEADEARRRLALSLAISGRKADALGTLDPLIARRDPGARRARALILALNGDVESARQAIGVMMPGASAGFDPFLRRLPTLKPAQKAAAVHLGLLPAEGVALAAAEPAQPEPEPIKVAAATPRPATSPPAPPKPRPDRLADIENTLVKLPPFANGTATKPPPAPKPILDKPRPKVAAEEAPTDLKSKLRLAALDPKSKVSTDKKADAKKGEKSGKSTKEEEAKTAATKAGAKKGKGEDREDEKPVRGSRIYVQIAGGSNPDDMAKEFAKIRSRKAVLFKGRTPLVSGVKGWSRLVVGPFKDADDAQEFVNDLHAARLEGFVWTAPSGTKLEKLASK